MEITCPQCSSRFNLPDKMARPGAKLRCTVCKNIFQLPGVPPRRAARASERQDKALLPEMAPRKKGMGRLLLWLLLILIVGCGGAGGYYWINRQQAQPVQDVAKNVELLTMRNVRQYNLLNEKVGKVFVIEGKVVNEFPDPRDFIELEGALYDQSRTPVAVKKQLAGSQLSLFQLQVLSEKEMDSFLNNKMEILANNTNVPSGGEVPFMILFYAPPDNVAEFGVKITDARRTPANS